MVKLWDSASIRPENWRPAPEIWDRKSPGLVVMPSSKTAIWTILGVLAFVAIFVGLSMIGTGYIASGPAPIEIGVFFPGTSEDNWTNFVCGVRAAAKEIGLEIEERPNPYECVVPLQPAPVRFQWYPEVGSRGIQRRISELCRRPTPPLAIVGANNSYLTQAIAGELSRHSDSEKVPVLLMTTATADALINILPDRSFRFGFNNTHQAKVVTERLKQHLTEQKRTDRKLEAVIVQVLDNPFSMDLARHFSRALRSTFDIDFCPPPPGFFDARFVDHADPDNLDVSWSLETSTGGFDVPNEEEKKLAREIVRRMVAKPETQWILVLPIGTTPYRRISFAIHNAFSEIADKEAAAKARANLVVLSGDSMDYHDFREAIINQLLPEETPAPIIFFAHVNPLESTASKKNDSHASARILDREVARALFSVLPGLGPDPAPAALAAALLAYKGPDSQAQYFENRERRTGGGAILAIPDPGMQKFEIRLPAGWQ